MAETGPCQPVWSGATPLSSLCMNDLHRRGISIASSFYDSWPTTAFRTFLVVASNPHLSQAEVPEVDHSTQLRASLMWLPVSPLKPSQPELFLASPPTFSIPKSHDTYREYLCLCLLFFPSSHGYFSSKPLAFPGI